jgi:hypothetical protein
MMGGGDLRMGLPVLDYKEPERRMGMLGMTGLLDGLGRPSIEAGDIVAGIKRKTEVSGNTFEREL